MKVQSLTDDEIKYEKLKLRHEEEEEIASIGKIDLNKK